MKKLMQKNLNYRILHLYACRDVMKTIALLGAKGGGGKSTLAIHLSVAAMIDGRRSAIADVDPQKSAAFWRNARTRAEPEVVSVSAGNLDDALKAAKNDGYQVLFLDTPPHTASVTAKAAKLADYILIPVQPSPLDIAALSPTVEIVKASNKPSAVVINRTQARSVDTADALEAVKAMGLTAAPVCISDRVAYKRALLEGLTVNEYDATGAAASEITALWTWIKKEVKRK